MRNVKHFVIVGFLVLLVTFVTDLGLTTQNLLPRQASAQAVTIDWLFGLQFKTISFLFALIMVPLVYSLVVFRRKAGDTEDAEHVEGHTNLEIAWTLVPLIVVVVFAYIGAGNLAETRRVDPEAMRVKVIGFQWSWRFEYPDSGVVSNELYLPVDQQVLLQMESPDVLHSFWVPEFRVKQDLVPGRVTELRVTPNLIGEYVVRCAELCGVSHSYMESPVIVVSRADFDAWIAQKQAEAAAITDPVELGKKLVAENGCAACHSIDGSVGIGPTWKGLLGEEVKLADGTMFEGDEAYIIESIKDPNAKIVEGYQPNAMPQFSFTDEQIGYIVEYIKTLK